MCARRALSAGKAPLTPVPAAAPGTADPGGGRSAPLPTATPAWALALGVPPGGRVAGPVAEQPAGALGGETKTPGSAAASVVDMASPPSHQRAARVRPPNVASGAQRRLRRGGRPRAARRRGRGAGPEGGGRLPGTSRDPAPLPPPAGVPPPEAGPPGGRHRPAQRRRDPGAGRRGGTCGPPARLGPVVTEGSRGRGRRRGPGRAGRRGPARSGPRFPRRGVPARLPAAPRAPPSSGGPATTAGQPHSPHLARLLCLLRGRHLAEA